jgi:hypothetical protein
MRPLTGRFPGVSPELMGAGPAGAQVVELSETADGSVRSSSRSSAGRAGGRHVRALTLRDDCCNQFKKRLMENSSLMESGIGARTGRQGDVTSKPE